MIPVRTPLRRCFVGMIVQFSRSVQRRVPGLAPGLSKLNSMAPRVAQDPGPVDIRNRLELGAARDARRAFAGAPCPGAP